MKKYTKEQVQFEAMRQIESGLGGMYTAKMLKGGVPVDGIPEFGEMWGSVLDSEEFDQAVKEVDQAIEQAVPLSGWSVTMGADRLLPYPGAMNIGSKGGDRARIMFAFSPGTHPEMIRELVERVEGAFADLKYGD